MTISKRRRHRNRPKRKAAQRAVTFACRSLIGELIYGPSLVEQIVPPISLAINRGL
mgnify:CR=1 FL=1